MGKLGWALVIIGATVVVANLIPKDRLNPPDEPRYAVAKSNTCVGVDEFNSASLYVQKNYSLSTGLRIRDIGGDAGLVTAGVIVTRDMNTLHRAPCRDLIAVFGDRATVMFGPSSVIR